MSQNDFNLANQGFPSMRSDMNSALQALASNSAGATEPSTTYAYQWWYDETTDILKMRNADNDAWISFATFDQAADTWTLIAEAGLTVNNDAATVLTVDRATSDGSILDFKKDGTTVGSIGSNYGDKIYIGSSTYGLAFGGGIHPWNPSTNSVNDNAVDLGYSTGRYKDLYLSGGVYLGGTGAANKLDDYETGTWTPEVGGLTTNPSVTYAFRNGYYTKVGQLVSVHFRINVSSISGGSGLARIINLPFTVAALSNGHVQVAALSTMSGPAAYNGAFAEPTSNWMYLNTSNGNTFDASTLGTGIFYASFTYRSS